MREFFRGWRRKAGVVTLLLACVFTAAWVRSYDSSDQISFANGALATDTVLSSNGLVFWNRLQTRQPQKSSSLNRWFTFPTERVKETFLDPLHFEWQWCGFGVFKDHSVERAVFDGCFIPYGSFVVPLTLFSAWLLLSRPSNKFKPTIEPTGENQ